MSSSERLSSSSVGPFDPMPDLITPSEHSTSSSAPARGGSGTSTTAAERITTTNHRPGTTAITASAASVLTTDESTRTISEGVKNAEHGSRSLYGHGTDRYYNEQEAEMSVLTETHLETHKINWRIDSRTLHIATLAPKGDKRGVIEANLVKKGHRFKLELCASGWRNSQDNYAAFYLTVADEGDLFVARYRVRVGEIQRISSIRHDFHLGVGFPNFCLQPALTDLMHNDQVNFYVTVEVFSCSSDVKSPPMPPRLPVSQRSDEVLSGLVRQLFKRKEHSDVTLECSGGKKISAHKCLLSAASPVFRSMFSHQMVESMTNTVLMSSWSVHCVRLMVYFVYHGELPGTHTILMQQQQHHQQQQQREIEMEMGIHHHRSYHTQFHRYHPSKPQQTSEEIRSNGSGGSATKLLRSADCLTSPSPDSISVMSGPSSESVSQIRAAMNTGGVCIDNSNNNDNSGKNNGSAVAVAINSNGSILNESNHRILNDCSLITGLDEDDDDEEEENDMHRPYSIRRSPIINHTSSSTTSAITAGMDDTLMMVDQTVQADIEQQHHHRINNNTGLNSSEEDVSSSSFSTSTATDEDISMESCKKIRAKSMPASIVTINNNDNNDPSCLSSSATSTSTHNSSMIDHNSVTSLSKSQSPLSLRMADGTRRVIRGNRHSKSTNTASFDESSSSGSSSSGDSSAMVTRSIRKHCIVSSDQKMVIDGGCAARVGAGSSSSVSAAGMSSAGIYFDLFALAEYYEIEPLVIACCERMFNNLTVDSACDLLIKIQIFSHVRSVAQIEESVWSFVTDNIHKVKRTEGYAKMLRNHPALLERLIDRIT